MALIVVDDDLARAPGSLVHIFHQRHAAGFELSGKGSYVVGLEVEMEMLAFIHVSDRRPLSRRATGEVGQVVDAEASGDFAQACAAGGEEAAQEAAFVQFLDSGPPALGG